MSVIYLEIYVNVLCMYVSYLNAYHIPLSFLRTYITYIHHTTCTFIYLYSTTEKFSQKVFTKSLLLKNLKKEHKVVRGREEKKTNDYATRL